MNVKEIENAIMDKLTEISEIAKAFGIEDKRINMCVCGDYKSVFSLNDDETDFMYYTILENGEEIRTI